MINKVSFPPSYSILTIQGRKWTKSYDGSGKFQCTFNFQYENFIFMLNPSKNVLFNKKSLLGFSINLHAYNHHINNIVHRLREYIHLHNLFIVTPKLFILTVEFLKTFLQKTRWWGLEISVTPGLGFPVITDPRDGSNPASSTGEV